MKEEFLVQLIELLNVVVCLSVIFVMAWHSVVEKNAKPVIILFNIILLAMLLYKVLTATLFVDVIVLWCLIIILYQSVRQFRLTARLPAADQAPCPETIQNVKLKAQEQERSRIYANIHDDVGAQLLQLVYSVKDEESRKIAKQVLNNLRQAVASTQNIQLTVQQLASEIINESLSRLQGLGIAMKHQIYLQDDSKKLSIVAPSVISRILREVVSNVIKHAQASQVDLSINSTKTELLIKVEDNGDGFLDDRESGKGLKTIKKRATSINAQVQWHTEKNKGCTFTLAYPL